MTELKPVLLLKSLNSNITGIMGDEQLTGVFNQIFEELIPKMLIANSNDIGLMISKYVTPIANDYLHKLTLSDIIGGGCCNGNDKPCIV